jgi:membrane protease YdiL (CAAX protease family)
MKKHIFLPLLAIVSAELMFFFNHIYAGLVIHIVTLLAILLVLIFSGDQPEIIMVYQSILLVSLLRITNLAMPQFFTVTIMWYPMIYGIMYIPIYHIVKHQQISLRDLGLNYDHLNIYLPAGLLLGSLAALVEYDILHPNPLIKSIQLSNLVLIGMIMFAFVGVVEELIFRSILQTRFEKVLGPKYSIILTGIFFGMMHAAYGLINEILFAASFGIILGYLFQKTKSFPLILSAHGIANILLYGVLPFIL